MKLLNIGFGNMVSFERMLAVVGPESAPIKRLVQEARERGMLIDATYGRKTASVLIMDSDHVVLSALRTEKMAARLGLSVSELEECHNGKGKDIYYFGAVRRGKKHRAEGLV